MRSTKTITRTATEITMLAASVASDIVPVPGVDVVFKILQQIKIHCGEIVAHKVCGVSLLLILRDTFSDLARQLIGKGEHARSENSRSVYALQKASREIKVYHSKARRRRRTEVNTMSSQAQQDYVLIGCSHLCSALEVIHEQTTKWAMYTWFQTFGTYNSFHVCFHRYLIPSQCIALKYRAVLTNV